MASSENDIDVDLDWRGTDSSWDVHGEPGRCRRPWVAVAGAAVVILSIAGILQSRWEASSVVADPPTTSESPVTAPIPDTLAFDGTVPDERPIVADQPLLSLLDDWSGIAGAMILQGVPRSSETGNLVSVTVVGDQVTRFPTASDSLTQPLWVSGDGQIVAFSDGAGRSNRGEWSSITTGDTIVAYPKDGALWSVSYERRSIARLDSDAPNRFEDYELRPDVERILGRLDNGFLVVRSLESGGSEFAIWTDEGSVDSIYGLAGREILHISSSTILLRAAEQRVVAMDLSQSGTVTAKASMRVDFDIDRACMSPDETLVAAFGSDSLGTARFAVIEMDSGQELLFEPLVDDFAWIAHSKIVFTRRNSLLASDLGSDPRRVAQLSPDYSWQVASSSSAC